MCAIDGYSRQCVALAAQVNNSSSALFSNMLPAIRDKGVPALLRIDAGMENVAIAKFMKVTRGDDSILIGRSVNNQRVERFWRDARQQVLHKYVDFCLDVSRSNPAMTHEHGIWLMQYMFLPRIQEELAIFQNTWNNHSMRTVTGNLSPNALTSTGRRDYYKQLTDEEITAAMDPLADQYQGRQVARGESPFQTQHWEDTFKSIVPPLDVDVHSDDWFDVLQNAGIQLHIHSEIENGHL